MSDNENPKTLLVAPKATGVLESEMPDAKPLIDDKDRDAAAAFMIYSAAHLGAGMMSSPYAVDSPRANFGPAPRRYRNLTSSKIRTTPKLSRNAPCPCGSGNKNKKCCGVAVMPGSE